jgi:predicted RNase H-like HicB family nuclease
MKTTRYVYWQDGDYYIGYLVDFPDYLTQGMTKDELMENLKDLLKDIDSGEVPYIRKVEELVFA